MTRTKLLPDGRTAYYPFGNWDGRIAPSQDAIQKVTILRVGIGLVALFVVLPTISINLGTLLGSSASLRNFHCMAFFGLYYWVDYIVVSWTTADWKRIVEPREREPAWSWKFILFLCFSILGPIVFLAITRPSFTPDSLFWFIVPVLMLFAAADMLIDRKRRVAWCAMNFDISRVEMVAATSASQSETSDFQQQALVYKKL